MSYESVNGFGDEMSDLLSSVTARPAAVAVTGGSAPGTGNRPPPITPDWTPQTYVPPVYGKTTATRTPPPTFVMPLPMPLTRPPPIQVTPPSGQRPPMRPKVVFGPPPFAGGSAPLPSECPSCQAAKEIPWIWIVVAVVVGGGAGYMIKQQMKKKPGEEGGTP